MIEVMEGEVEQLQAFADALRDAADAVALAADEIRTMQRVMRVYRGTLERIAAKESGVWGDWARGALYAQDRIREGQHDGEGVLVDSEGRARPS